MLSDPPVSLTPMPPAKKRPRAYDFSRTRTAVLAQFAQVREVVRTLTPEQLAGPAGPGGWTVRDLAEHLTTVIERVSSALELPEPAGGPKPQLTLLEWPFSTAEGAGRTTDGTRAPAGEWPGLDSLYEETAARFAALVPSDAGDRLVTTRAGTMRLGDFLVTRTVELVVHTDDLHRATGIDIPYDRQALAACTRLLADALADRAPGVPSRCASRPSRSCSASAGPSTPGARRPTSWRRIRSPGSGWPRAVRSGRGRWRTRGSVPVGSGPTSPRCSL